MDDGIAELGFWLMVGMVVAASIVSAGIKERDKERDKQAMLRALLETDSKSMTEVLAYLRERDAAEAAEAARARKKEAETAAKFGAGVLGVAAFAAGIFSFAALRFGILRNSESVLVWLVALIAMLGIWTAGIYIVRRLWRSIKQKYDARPDA